MAVAITGAVYWFWWFILMVSMILLLLLWLLFSGVMILGHVEKHRRMQRLIAFRAVRASVSNTSYFVYKKAMWNQSPILTSRKRTQPPETPGANIASMAERNPNRQVLPNFDQSRTLAQS